MYKCSWWVLAIFFVFSSFAFGCMEGWAIAACEAALFTGAGLAGWNRPEFWAFPWKLRYPAALVALLVLVGCLQMIPLPASMGGGLARSRKPEMAAGAKAEELLHSESYLRAPLSPEGSTPRKEWSPLTPGAGTFLQASYTPAQTARAVLALLAVGCLILLLEDAVSHGFGAIRALLWVVGLCGLLVTIVALVQFTQTSRTTIMGIVASKYAALSLGPFINRNHGAAFVNIALPLLYYLLWRKAVKMRKLVDRVGMKFLVGGLLLLQVCVLVGYSSRGALVTLVLYPLVWGIRYSSRLGISPKLTGVLMFIVLAAATAYTFRMGLVSDSDRAYLNSNVPAQGWLLGSGLGSFEERFPAVWTSMPMGAPLRNTHLENEYMQIFFEAGILPAIAAVAVGLAAIWLSFRVACGRSAAFWMAPALAGETIHAAVDFTGHVLPIVGAYLLVWAVSEVAVRHPKES